MGQFSFGSAGTVQSLWPLQTLHVFVNFSVSTGKTGVLTMHYSLAHSLHTGRIGKVMAAGKAVRSLLTRAVAVRGL